MDLERNEATPIRSAPLAQIGLAALVAGSLLVFSALAFRTAFTDGSAPGSLKANDPQVTSAAPVLLPASKDATSPAPSPATGTIAASTGDPRGDIVLGTRVTRTEAAARATQVTEEQALPTGRPSARPDDWHHKRDGKGHEKAQGKGHQKTKKFPSARDLEAREEDDEWDDHGDDDDGRDDDDDTGSSRSGSGNSGGSGSQGGSDKDSGSSKG